MIFCINKLQIHLQPMNKTLFAVLVFVSTSITHATCAYDAHEKVAVIVVRILRADYEGDRAAMQRGFDDLAPFMEQKEIASRVRYWRGFAQWRRAINGFNDAVDPKEQEKDLNTALDEFKIALERDPRFVDAKLGIMSCNGLLLFVEPKDEARRRERIERILALEKEATAMAPDNPRSIWVRGPILWNTPPERGGGENKALENYQRGLEVCSKMKTSDDRLEPSWGKPELMMNLAYGYLNTKANPDLDAAERYARAALDIVPYWHYVRDILLPQIVAAKTKVQ
jgi:tetratricopeptide (TPR) repeat protein